MIQILMSNENSVMDTFIVKNASRIGAVIGLMLTVFILPSAAVGADPKSLLFEAVQADDVERVRGLIEGGADVEARREAIGITPLGAACRAGCLGTATLLVETGAKANTADDMGVTPLMWAISSGKVELVRLLLAKGASVSPKDGYGRTALTFAAQKGLTDVIRLLLECKADVNAKESVGGTTPLIMASYNGRLDAAKLLIESGAQVDFKDTNGETALLWASAQEDPQVVEFLIGSGADINTRDKRGFDALIRASLLGAHRTVKILLDKGVPLDGKYRDLSRSAELDWLESVGREETFRNVAQRAGDLGRLMRYQFPKIVALRKLPSGKGGGMMRPPDRDGSEAPRKVPLLMWAVLGNSTQVVEMLLDAGADPNATNSRGETALMWASLAGLPDMVKILLAKGAWVDRRETNGVSALDLVSELKKIRGEAHGADTKNLADLTRVAETLEKHLKEPRQDPEVGRRLVKAAKDGDSSLAREILDQGADPDAADAEEGSTSLHWAAFRGDAKLVAVLLAHGANVNAKNKDGRTPLIMAAAMGHRAAAAKLLARNAVKAHKDSGGKTALQWAERKGNLHLVKLLKD
jgi:uncharacterized protein